MAEELFDKPLRQGTGNIDDSLELSAEVMLWYLYRPSPVNWQFRPGKVKNGTININEDYFKGLEYFAKASDELADSLCIGMIWRK